MVNIENDPRMTVDELARLTQTEIKHTLEDLKKQKPAYDLDGAVDLAARFTKYNMDHSPEGRPVSRASDAPEGSSWGNRLKAEAAVIKAMGEDGTPTR